MAKAFQSDRIEVLELTGDGAKVLTEKEKKEGAADASAPEGGSAGARDR